MENIQLIEFSKNIKDLLVDLKTAFCDKTEHIINENSDLLNILNYDFEKLNNSDSEMDKSKEYESLIISSQNLFNYCKTVYPERFFDILYQNEEVFTNDSNTCFLPQIDFAQLYFDTTSMQTKETLWKYLQLILFSIVTSIDSKDSFGANTQLFEAINSDEFKNKLQDTVKQMEQMFNFKKNTQNTKEDSKEKDKEEKDKEEKDKEESNEPKLPFDFEKMFESMNLPSTEDMSNALPGNLPDSDSIFSHINGLINGKIGSLAKELAEETTKDLDIDMENVTDVNDVFKKLFKNPGNLMNLVNNISSKLDNKMKDGSIKESELLEEASSIFKNMKNMPGMDNMEQLFKSMNMDQFMPKGGKFNNNAFQHMMDQNVKMSKMKERMRKKQEAKTNSQPSYSTNYSETKETNSQSNSNSNSNSNFNPDTKNLNELNNNLASLMEQMQNMSGSGSSSSFINDILKKQSQSQDQGKNDSNGEIKKRKTNNKKKVNKKK
tara:strand:+ start:3690 stop:5165 length:1476 start_codon:yes stop_codon:yes gene_type:complete